MVLVAQRLLVGVPPVLDVGVAGGRDAVAPGVAVGIGGPEMTRVDVAVAVIGVAVARHLALGTSSVVSFTCTRQGLITIRATTAILVCEPSGLTPSRTKVCVCRG